jgi:hypothetical protein
MTPTVCPHGLLLAPAAWPDGEVTRYCRLCWLAQNDPAYRESWAAEARKRAALPCRHLGADNGQTVSCPTCRGKVALKVFSCALHSRCTPTRAVPEIACCADCADYAPFPPPTVRHLLYHVYPRWGSIWRTRLLRLRERLPLFNGRKLIAVAHDHTTEGCGMVEDALAGTGCEIFAVPNNPERREVETFPHLFGPLSGLNGPEHATLYGQAKGTTRPDGSTARRWAEALEETCLDYWPVVGRLLEHSPVVGPFKKVGRGWPENQSLSEWHFSGSWFWFRNDALFGKDWRRIDPFWSGIESYPSLHFGALEAGCICHAGQVPSLDLYDHAYWDDVVDPALAAFRRAHRRERLATEYLLLQSRWEEAGLPRLTGAEEVSYIAAGLEEASARGVPGCLLECGSFTGFSSACLSLACARAGRALVAADSFAGLPEPGEQGEEYHAGQFCCGLEAWRSNVRRFGDARAATPRPGWYAESLAGWSEPVAVLWLDVDLGSSVRDVLGHVLPHLSPGGRLYSHESRPEYFDQAGRIRPDRANAVWRALRLALGDRPYRARFLHGALAEVQLP